MRSLASTTTAVAVIASAVLTTGCGAGTDAGAVEVLTVESAWARPTPAGADAGVVYLTVTSPIDDTIERVSVAPAVAEAATMHRSDSDDAGGGHEGHDGGDDAGMATMTPQESVALGAGEPVVFEPGGLHVMLTGLATPLVDGDRFDLTLALAEAGRVDVDVVVAVNPP